MLSGELIVVNRYDSNYERKRSAIIERLIPFGFHQALDVGCGIGYFSNIMSLKGHSVIGVDINARNTDVAESAFGHNKRIRFFTCDVTKIKYQPVVGARRYDFICALEIIEHLDDYNEFIHNMVSLLAPKGKLLISTPNFWSLEGLNGRLWEWRTGKQFNAWDESHKHIFTSVEIINTLKKHRLKITKFVGYYYSTMNKLPLLGIRITMPFSSATYFPLNLFGFNTIIVAERIK